MSSFAPGLEFMVRHYEDLAADIDQALKKTKLLKR
jgi:hypothetical protein